MLEALKKHSITTLIAALAGIGGGFFGGCAGFQKPTTRAAIEHDEDLFCSRVAEFRSLEKATNTLPVAPDAPAASSSSK